MIRDLLDSARKKKVLFVGETIHDYYHFVRPLGRPLKESIISVEQVEEERYIGGVVAAREHAKAFCDPDLFTSRHMVIKHRWVEQSHNRKLFEVYEAISQPHQVEWPDLDAYDLVVVTDYGHGMMDPAAVQRLCDHAKYLAVNVQTNSGNYGFNLATKWPKVDYLVVDEPEARLATQNRAGPIEDSLEELSERADKVIITLGKQGSIGRHAGHVSRGTALTDKVVDTIGAGDAFFAITALIAQEADIGTIQQVGNAAGAIKTGIVGHRAAVSRSALLRSLGVS